MSSVSRSRAATRAERMDSYARLQLSVMRAQLRIGTLFTVHSAQYNVFNVVAVLSGYPSLVSVLNQLSDDFAEVTADWRRVTLLGDEASVKAAEDLLLALCTLLAHVDPGWHKPRARARRQIDLRQAKESLEAAATRFDAATRADAAPRRKDRRIAVERRAGESHAR